MVRIDQKTIAVCDAGPLIHLDELGSLDLLAKFRVWVPDAVWNEVKRHRPGALVHPKVHCERQTIDKPIAPSLSALGNALLLDAGEVEALAIMAGVPKSLFLTDDAAARLVAERLGYRVHGSIGILLRAIRRSQFTPAEVLARLQDIPLRSSLHIRPGLLADVISQVRHEYSL
ncbi:MAG: DNA-binding protein [Chloroflexi bacterium]|nr:DNA-binding protein [Chloroflexota bacterium]